MFEWVKEFIIALGGGTAALLLVLTLFKGLFVKFLESGIEVSFEKNLERFKNKLERSTRAYEILLEREMRFYEKIEPIVAELVPLVQDLKYYLEDNMELEHNKACENFQEHFKRYTEIIISLKNTNLIHQSYLPDNVFRAFNKLVIEMQDECEFWMDMAKCQVNNEYENIDNDKLSQKVDNLLICIAYAETLVKSRLREMCGE